MRGDLPRVEFGAEAQADLLTLHGLIWTEGGARRAGQYIDAIEARCLVLRDWTFAGTPRDDIGPGIRRLGHERRITILCRVDPDIVTILRILDAGRQP